MKRNRNHNQVLMPHFLCVSHAEYIIEIIVFTNMTIHEWSGHFKKSLLAILMVKWWHHIKGSSLIVNIFCMLIAILQGRNHVVCYFAFVVSFLWTPICMQQPETGVFMYFGSIRDEKKLFGCEENTKKSIISKLSAIGVFATHPSSCMLFNSIKILNNSGRPLLKFMYSP